MRAKTRCISLPFSLKIDASTSAAAPGLERAESGNFAQIPAKYKKVASRQSSPP
jgi:hypothetical protein